MKDETAFLQPVQDPEASHRLTPEEPPVAHLPLYRPGTRVAYEGQYYTVSHVVIHRSDLQVYLQELGRSVDATKVQLAPTRILLQRS